MRASRRRSREPRPTASLCRSLRLQTVHAGPCPPLPSQTTVGPVRLRNLRPPSLVQVPGRSRQPHGERRLRHQACGRQAERGTKQRLNERPSFRRDRRVRTGTSSRRAITLLSAWRGPSRAASCAGGIDHLVAQPRQHPRLEHGRRLFGNHVTEHGIDRLVGRHAEAHLPYARPDSSLARRSFRSLGPPMPAT